MSDPGAPLAASQPPGPQEYKLSDSLARLCLPSDRQDSCRTLAWVDSVCILFLAVGMVGLKSPEVTERKVSTPPDIVPVIFNPPVEQPKPQPLVQQEQPKKEQQETTIEAPKVPTVVAANTPNVAFAVPVEGPVVLAPVNRALPPPPVTQASAPGTTPAKPKTFVPGGGEGGTFPWPTSYPREAIAQRLQGTVMLYVMVDANGIPAQVDVKESSRHYVLDRFASQWVKTRWRWLPGERREFFVPFQFSLTNG